MSYKVSLQAFEGPFDLLVYLIENAQMDIFDLFRLILADGTAFQ